MPTDDRTPRVPQGPIGAFLIKNLEQIRTARRLTYQDLSVRLKEVGRPIPALGLSRIEKGTRRVDADDLVGLALALGVNPSALLFPREIDAQDPVSLTGGQAGERAADVWNWADGRAPMPAAGPFTRSTMDWQVAADFAKHARPTWAPLPDALQLLSQAQPAATPAAAQPVVAAIVTSALGVLVGKRNDGTPPWTFIAGEVEPGEQPEDAAVREVKEETGLEATAGEVIGARVHPATGRTMIYLAARPVRDITVIVGDEAELAEVRWVGLAEADELLPGMFGPVREHLSRVLGEATQ